MDLIEAHLTLCVPLEINHLQRQGGPEEWHIEEAQRRWKALRETPSGHESLMFRLGPTRSAIVVLVECLAVLAFMPGGVRFDNLHFDASRRGWTKETRVEADRQTHP